MNQPSAVSTSRPVRRLRRLLGATILPAALLLNLLPGAALPAWAQADPVLFPTPTAGVLLPTVTPAPTADPNAPPADLGPAAAMPAYVPGELLVGVRQSAAEAVAAGFGAAMAAAAPGMGIDAASVTVLETLDLGSPTDDIVTQLISVPPGSEYDVALALASVPGVVYVEPNGIVYAADEVTPAADDAAAPQRPFIVNDPEYDRQWHHQRIAMSRGWQLAFEDGGFGDQGDQVRVAIIDSGIDTTHPEFTGRIVANVNYTPQPNVDDCGHGTHIAALAAGALNNAVGGAGGAPNVQIDVRRVLYRSGGGCTGNVLAVASGIISATNAGADVINMSLEIPTDQKVFRDAIAYAVSQGVLPIAAAGNGGQNQISYPARYPGVMSVAALTIDDTKAIYSNSGPQQAIAAPGGQGFNPIWSAWSKDAVDRCTAPPIAVGALPPYYCGQSGTSQATGIVSGLAALLFSINPDLTAEQVRAILEETATPLTLTGEQGGAGKIDAELAVRTLLTPTVIGGAKTIVVNPIASDEPYTQTLRYENPSLQPITWTASLDADFVSAAISATNAISLTSAQTEGVISHGKPAFLTLRIDPALVDDSLSARLTFLGVNSAGDPFTNTVAITALDTPSVLLPIVRKPAGAGPDGAGPDGAGHPDFEWLEPADPLDRIVQNMVGITNTLVKLPFSVTLDSQSYADLRLYADGFVALPYSLPPFPTVIPELLGQNVCLPATDYPTQAVYGWWADMDAADPDATLSTFPLGDRFVVEYENLPAVGTVQPYTVTFQIVLSQDDGVQLNYQDVPAFVGRPEAVTVGVESTSGRYWNQVACATSEFVYHELPTSGQTILITPEEIF